MQEKILVLDFGGQYNQLIAKRVRQESVYAEIKSIRTPIAEIKEAGYKGIILTGGPHSVYNENSPKYDPKLFELGIPILGICYGAQFIAQTLGGKVQPAEQREYGEIEVKLTKSSNLFNKVNEKTICWMSHTDHVTTLPDGFTTLANSNNCAQAAFADENKKIYAVQYHPEVDHSVQGQQILHNFLYEICGCTGDWQMPSFVENTIADLKVKLAGKKVLCAFSGGVDSSVAALLVHKAIGHNLQCIFVDHGLLRKNEGDEVEKVFGEHFAMNIKRVNAQERFYAKLAGVVDPEAKRKIIGEEFIRVFEEEANKIGEVDVLVQGTIYPDIVESGIGEGAVIKSHHNVGGLPKNISFKELVEPLRYLFKDEVRAAGTEMGIPEHLVWRQPFPGPGLGVRIIGDITAEKVQILQDADAIFREEMKNFGMDKASGQYFAVLTNIQSVGVMGDSRTYDFAVALRAVATSDFMTADWVRLPYELLQVVSSRIVNEVGHINRVVYDITSKPPATIEWE